MLFLLLLRLEGPNANGGFPTAQADPEYPLRSWDTLDGLPENSATSIAQGQDGYLWFTVQPHYWQTGWFRGGVGLLMVALGGAVAWLGSHRRIAHALERERLAHELQHLREALAHSARVSVVGQLASGLAHELNQPLGAILRNAEAASALLEQTPPDLVEIRAIIDDILRDDQRAGGVIDRMRAMLKRGKVEQVPLSIAELLREVTALIRPDALRRNVQTTMEVAHGLPSVRGDRIQLQQVLLNLLLNAMDAMIPQPPENRRLAISARMADAQTLEVRVCDSGTGVPPESLPRVFEPFFSTKVNGLGLGLPISRTIIEAHHGRIWAENRPEGGSCFGFTLPCTTAEGTDLRGRR